MPARLRILIVDDIPADAELIEHELRRAGLFLTTRRVDTEPAFRDELREFAPDLILTDHSMPRFSAADALRIAQAERPDTP
ncbi:MAG TPA: response regulator, partial [Gemmatimonadales bacterium]|nr:response regulator [Gemmatimonadales bacterium]